MPLSWLQQQKVKLASRVPFKSKAESPSQDSAATHLNSLVGSLRGYAQGRIELAKAEFHELLEQLKPILALIFLLAALGVFLLILFEVALFASLLHFLSWPPYLVALVMAGAHFLLLAIFALILRGKLKSLKPFAQSQALQKREKEQLAPQNSSQENTTTQAGTPSGHPSVLSDGPQR